VSVFKLRLRWLKLFCAVSLRFFRLIRTAPDSIFPKQRKQYRRSFRLNFCRTLEYLTRHLFRVAARYNDTGMTAKNVAIVWAPNLLRCKSLEVGGVAALQGVGIQVSASADCRKIPVSANTVMADTGILWFLL
jgi:hypothetical protein